MAANNVIFKKTKMCRFYIMGNCARGAACAFAHSGSELRPLPNFRKTRLCHEFGAAGACRQGGACPFAHGSAELRHHTRKDIEGPHGATKIRYGTAEGARVHGVAELPDAATHGVWVGSMTELRHAMKESTRAPMPLSWGAEPEEAHMNVLTGDAFADGFVGQCSSGIAAQNALGRQTTQATSPATESYFLACNEQEAAWCRGHRGVPPSKAESALRNLGGQAPVKEPAALCSAEPERESKVPSQRVARAPTPPSEPGRCGEGPPTARHCGDSQSKPGSFLHYVAMRAHFGNAVRGSAFGLEYFEKNTFLHFRPAGEVDDGALRRGYSDGDLGSGIL